MEYSKLSNLNTVFFIPRRGKGHSEVLARVEILSYSNAQVENFLDHFTAFQKTTLTKEDVLTIGLYCVEKLKLTDLIMHISFSLPISRLSPSLEEAICLQLQCKYSFIFTNGNYELSMKIECPVRVDYVSTLKGNLSLQITQPATGVYFEDLLDLVLKYGDVIIYPIRKEEDRALLMKAIDKGKTVEDYLDFIKVAAIHKAISRKGLVSLSFEDLYNNHTVEKGKVW